MTDAFDPYRRWLGIPPEEQPPNHYRLLGVGVFENDAEVIQEAADRQMAHVQRHKLGQYSSISQKLLNEIATAKLCLLKPDRKAEYDEQLRDQLAAEANALAAALPVAAQVTPLVAPQPVMDFSSTPAESAARSIRREPARGRAIAKSKNKTQLFMLGGALAALIAVVGIALMLRGGGEPTVQKAPLANAAPQKADEPRANHQDANGGDAKQPASDPQAAAPAEPAPNVTEPAEESARPDEVDDPSTTPPSVAQPTGEVVDLLQIIKVKNRLTTGNWRKGRSGLALLPSDTPFPHVCVLYQPPNEYQLEMRITPQPGATVILDLLAGGQPVALVLDGWGGETSGLQMIESAPGNANASTHRGRVLEPNQPNKLQVTVRGDSIEVTCNDRPAVRWHGPAEKLSLAPVNHIGGSPPTSLALGGGQGQGFSISSLTLTTISGSGRELTVPVVDNPQVARVDPPASDTTPPPINTDQPPAKAAPTSIKSTQLFSFGTPVRALGLCMNGKRLVAVGGPGKGHDGLQLWDVGKKRRLATFGTLAPGEAAPSGFNGLFITEDGLKLVVVGNEGLWAIDTKARVAKHSKFMFQPAIGISGDATCSKAEYIAGRGQFGTLTASNWDSVPSNGDLTFGQTTGVAMSADGQYATITTGGEWQGDKPIVNGPGMVFAARLNNRDLANLSLLIERGPQWCVATSANAIAVGGEDGTIRVWNAPVPDAQGFAVAPVSALSGHQGAVYAVAISGDGKRLLSGGADKTIRVWDLEKNEELMRGEGHTDLVRGVALSPDAKVAYSAGNDQTVRMWELTKGAAPLKSGSGGSTGSSEPLAKEELRTPVPKDEDVEASVKALKEVFDSDYKAARKPPERLALAEKLLAQARDAQNEAERYAIFSEARRLAGAGGSPALGIQITEQIGAAFDVDVAKEVLAYADPFTKEAIPSTSRKELAEAVLPWAEAAFERGDFSLSRKLFSVASKAAAKTNEAALTKQIAARVSEVGEAKKLADAHQKALAALEANADDADAHLAVGKYLCFVKHDWDAGLAHLAKCGDATLKDAAALEIASPTTPEDQVKLGDLWWTLYEAAKGKERSDFGLRADKWYSSALPGLKGLSQTRISKRLEELAGSAKVSAPVAAAAEKPAAANGAGAKSGAAAIKTLATRIQKAIKRDALVRTAVAGTGQGTPFLEAPPAGLVLAGLNVSFDPDNDWLTSVQPVYWSAKGGSTPGAVFGYQTGAVRNIVAKPGYAVAGLHVSSTYNLFGLEVVFAKITDTGLNMADQYTSPWEGEQRPVQHPQLGAQRTSDFRRVRWRGQPGAGRIRLAAIAG